MSTPFHSAYWSLLLTTAGPSGSIAHLARSIAGARVDLNPHQVDAALFALRSPLSRGVLLADEVGLGKTIEAGLVLAQRWAERRRRILVIAPAILRVQWKQELETKFLLPVRIVDSRTRPEARDADPLGPFAADDAIQIVSYHLASSRSAEIERIPWDLVVIDEAHRLRNVQKSRDNMARRIADATSRSFKLLLTATPLQNSLTELQGLVSVVDEQVFADPAVFRDRFVRPENEALRNAELRARLEPICRRTLRKQVREYVSFTRRIAITQDFSPGDDEQSLYDDVSAFLGRDDLFGLAPARRGFTEIVLRKLLASSTFAIAPTFRRIADRLESAPSDGLLVGDDDLADLAASDEEWRDQDASETSSSTNAPARRLTREDEIAALRGFAERAERIRANSKGERLVPALQHALERARSLGAPAKAVIFTESRPTQDYLVELLEARGFAGQVVAINGANTDARSRGCLEGWRRRHPDAARTLSRDVATKAALVEEFRERATILVATEAAAEGVNLQFCALVVNYDLPWNPQRVEQRIGRCHRYGQSHDVVVLNLLNRRNAADGRVFELLRDKFKLFDGVFGASDEVLGAIESGVDVERRIADVYRTCRTAEEIDAAFAKLRAELDDQIQTRMRDTRAALLEHFDEEVTERLRVHRDRTAESLSNRERWLLDLTRFELGDRARFDAELPRFQLDEGDPDAPSGTYDFDWRRAEQAGGTFYREAHPLAERLIRQALRRELEASRLVVDLDGRPPGALGPLVGCSGWIAVARLSIRAFDEVDFVLLAGAVEDEPLDEDRCRRLLALRGRVEPAPRPAIDARASFETVAAARRSEAAVRNVRVFDEEVAKLDRWSSDLKLGLERELKELDREIQEAVRRGALATTLEEKVSAQREVRRLEGARSKKRRELFEAQDAIDAQRGTLIEGMERQLQAREDLVVRFVVRWTLVGG